MANLELNDAADQSTEKRKAERNRRKKLDARKNKAEKARQEFEEQEMLGSVSQDAKIPSSVGSGKPSKSLASDCFDGSGSIDCVVGSSALAQEKTEGNLCLFFLLMQQILTLIQYTFQTQCSKSRQAPEKVLGFSPHKISKKKQRF